MVAAYYVGLFSVLHLPIKRWRRALCVITPVAIGILFVLHYWNKGQTRIYLLDEWYQGVALVQMKQGPVFVVGNGLASAKVKNALYRIGRHRADAVLVTNTKPAKFTYDEFADKILYPFENAWPTETIEQFGSVHVRVVWGIHTTKEGRIWYNTGYSGSKQDDVSYCFSTTTEPDFCVGAGARFVSWQGHTVQSAVNQTVEVQL